MTDGDKNSRSATSTVNVGNEILRKASIFQEGVVTSEAHMISKPNPKYGLSITKTQVDVPKTTRFILKQPGRKAVMREEFDALIRNQTWRLIPRRKEDRSSD